MHPLCHEKMYSQAKVPDSLKILGYLHPPCHGKSTLMGLTVDLTGHLLWWTAKGVWYPPSNES